MNVSLRGVPASQVQLGRDQVGSEDLGMPLSQMRLDVIVDHHMEDGAGRQQQQQEGQHCVQIVPVDVVGLPAVDQFVEAARASGGGTASGRAAAGDLTDAQRAAKQRLQNASLAGDPARHDRGSSSPAAAISRNSSSFHTR